MPSNRFTVDDDSNLSQNRNPRNSLLAKVINKMNSAADRLPGKNPNIYNVVHTQRTVKSIEIKLELSSLFINCLTRMNKNRTTTKNKVHPVAIELVSKRWRKMNEIESNEQWSGSRFNRSCGHIKIQMMQSKN